MNLMYLHVVLNSAGAVEQAKEWGVNIDYEKWAAVEIIAQMVFMGIWGLPPGKFSHFRSSKSVF